MEAMDVMDDAVIQFDHVTKQYGKVKAVDDLSFEVRRGEICGFLGPNGAGKTTSLRMLLGLVRPTTGRIRIHGIDVNEDTSSALAGVGAIIEESHFYPYLTGEQNLRQVLRLRGLSTSTEVIGARLAEVGLREVANRRVKGYSLGMRQRLALALAMLQEPDILVLDEPMNGLDPAAMREFRLHLQRLQQSGVTILLSSHILSEVEQLATRMVFINHGRAVGMEETHHDRSVEVLVRARDEAALMTHLANLEHAARRISDGGAVVALAHPNDVSGLIRTLVEAQVDLLEVRPYRENLEAQYLARINNESQDTNIAMEGTAHVGS
ncbi:ABC transporter ATP-binding protein [Sulfobacillus harzensis]|uniref:ABC transporter ATP-binding protein n=1 Tax=Sulfobacillus harzensis TaxID=2729629 RepID=A0A7Y0L0Q2_9FIRM|nr:ABC transporter ATP-binding protein [Sulfobacillus harzensis]NMP20893.1 ABC transporter ATP-binding protein [Sulfobacillus harzensis]